MMTRKTSYINSRQVQYNLATSKKNSIPYPHWMKIPLLTRRLANLRTIPLKQFQNLNKQQVRVNPRNQRTDLFLDCWNMKLHRD